MTGEHTPFHIFPIKQSTWVPAPPSALRKHRRPRRPSQAVHTGATEGQSSSPTAQAHAESVSTSLQSTRPAVPQTEHWSWRSPSASDAAGTPPERRRPCAVTPARLQGDTQVLSPPRPSPHRSQRKTEQGRKTKQVSHACLEITAVLCHSLVTQGQPTAAPESPAL